MAIDSDPKRLISMERDMSQPKPRKTQRATRQPKTNFTRVQTNCDPWSRPPALDFEKLESAYVSLGEKARDEILSIVQDYLWQDQSEHEAFPLREAEAAIDDLERPIENLIVALDTRGDNNVVATAVRGFVDSFGRANEISCLELLSKLEGFRIAAARRARKSSSAVRTAVSKMGEPGAVWCGNSWTSRSATDFRIRLLSETRRGRIRQNSLPLSWKSKGNCPGRIGLCRVRLMALKKRPFCHQGRADLAAVLPCAGREG
jgi:hypothetical protein